MEISADNSTTFSQIQYIHEYSQFLQWQGINSTDAVKQPEYDETLNTTEVDAADNFPLIVVNATEVEEYGAQIHFSIGPIKSIELRNGSIHMIRYRDLSSVADERLQPGLDGPEGTNLMERNIYKFNKLPRDFSNLTNTEGGSKPDNRSFEAEKVEDTNVNSYGKKFDTAMMHAPHAFLDDLKGEKPVSCIYGFCSSTNSSSSSPVEDDVGYSNVSSNANEFTPSANGSEAHWPYSWVANANCSHTSSELFSLASLDCLEKTLDDFNETIYKLHPPKNYSSGPAAQNPEESLSSKNDKNRTDEVVCIDAVLAQDLLGVLDVTDDVFQKVGKSSGLLHIIEELQHFFNTLRVKIGSQIKFDGTGQVGIDMR